MCCDITFLVKNNQNKMASSTNNSSLSQQEQTKSSSTKPRSQSTHSLPPSSSSSPSLSSASSSNNNMVLLPKDFDQNFLVYDLEYICYPGETSTNSPPTSSTSTKTILKNSFTKIIRTKQCRMELMQKACFILNKLYEKSLWSILISIFLHLHWLDFSRVAALINFNIWECIGNVKSRSSQNILRHCFSESINNSQIRSSSLQEFHYYNNIIIDAYRLRDLTPHKLLLEALSILTFPKYKTFESTFNSCSSFRGSDKQILFNPKFPIIAILTSTTIQFYAYDRFHLIRKKNPSGYLLTYEFEDENMSNTCNRISWSPDGTILSLYYYDDMKKNKKTKHIPETLKFTKSYFSNIRKLMCFGYDQFQCTVKQIKLPIHIETITNNISFFGFNCNNHWIGTKADLLFLDTLDDLYKLSFCTESNTVSIKCLESLFTSKILKFPSINYLPETNSPNGISFPSLYPWKYTISPLCSELVFSIHTCHQVNHSHHKIHVYSLKQKKAMYVIDIPGLLTSIDSPNDIIFSFIVLKDRKYDLTNTCYIRKISDNPDLFHWKACMYDKIYKTTEDNLDRFDNIIHSEHWNTSSLVKHLHVWCIKITPSGDDDDEKNNDNYDHNDETNEYVSADRQREINESLCGSSTENTKLQLKPMIDYR